MRPEKLRAYGALTILVLALGLIATSAQAADCQNLTIEGGHITSRTGNVETVHTALVGNLWVNTGELETDADLGVGSVSHPIPDFDSSVVVCPDGSVSFTALPLVEDAVSAGAVSPPSVPVEADPMTVETVIDVEPVFVFDLDAWFAYMAEALA